MIFNNSWIRAEGTTFTEKLENKKKKYYLITRILPKNKISRNKVKYNWATVERTIHQIAGIPLNHNHKFKEANDLPRGKWIRGWVEEDGAHGIAEVYDTEYNKDYIEWLKAAKDVTVSLNVSGNSQVMNSQEGAYQEAFINDWREISTVNVPGFLDAKSSLEVILSESLKEEIIILEMDKQTVDLTGMADKKKITEKDVDAKELAMGLKVEMEHTKEESVAKQIALDHLAEISDYYTRLDKMEKEANIKEADETAAVEEVAPENIDINPAQEEEGEALDSTYNLDELKNGIIQELNYTNDPYEAKQIAKKNIDDDKEYYSKLQTEKEDNKKNDIYVIKDKLDVIANRRYGNNYDALTTKEQNKVLFSTDIEKGVNDELADEIKTHYVKKTVEENIDKIINTKSEKEESINEEFFEKLNDTKQDFLFFKELNKIRRI